MKHTKLLYNTDLRKFIFLMPEHINFDFDNTAQSINSTNKLIDNLRLEQCTDVVGSSANAIVTLLIGLGYTPAEINFKLNILHSNIIFNNKNDKFNALKYNTPSLSRQFKFSSKDDFISWSQAQISKKLKNPMATFSDLHRQIKDRANLKNMHFIVLNITTGRLEIFNNKNTPDIPILMAVRICMSTFTEFSSVKINNSLLGTNNIYLDSGVILQHMSFEIKAAVFSINSSKKDVLNRSWY